MRRSALSKINDIFLPGIENHIKEGSADRGLRLKTVLYASLTWIVTALLFIAFRWWYLRDLNLNILTLVLVVISFCALVLYQRKTLNDIVSSAWLNILFFIFVPLRTWQTGGLYSPVIFLFAGNALAVFALYGKKRGVLTLGLGIVWVFVFASFTGDAYLPATPLYTTPLNRAISNILISGLIVVPVFLVLNTKDFYLKKLRRVERKRMSYCILNEIRNESLAGLSEDLDALDRVVETGNFEGLEKVVCSLRELDRSMKALSRAVDSGDIGDKQ